MAISIVELRQEIERMRGKPLNAQKIEFFGRKRSWDSREVPLLFTGQDPTDCWRSDGMFGSYIKHYNLKAKEYEKLLDASCSAKEFNDFLQISMHGWFEAKPETFLAWADHLDLSYPKELADAVAKTINRPNWQKLYEEAKRELETLKTKIGELEALQKPENPREIETYQKLLIAVAVEFGEYNPHQIPKDFVRSVIDSCGSLGVKKPPSDETIRNKLKESAKLVDQNTQSVWSKKALNFKNK